MSRFRMLSVLTGTIACAPHLTSPPSASQQPTLVITNVSVLPMESAELLHDRTVLIAGDRIISLTGGSLPVPAEVQRVDGRGMYLIPGLWDMHVHSFENAGTSFPQFLAHGITGVRDMGGHLDSLVRLRHRLGSGELVGPRLVAAGPVLDGPRHRWSHSIAWHISSADEARAAVDSLARTGVDFLKAYSTLPAEAYRALTEAARARGLAIVGHVPLSISAEEASRLGQRSLEHAGLDITTLPCVPEGGNRMNRLLGVWGSEGYRAYLSGLAELRQDRDEACVGRLYATFQANETWVTPTIVNTIKDRSSVDWAAMESLSAEQRQSCEGTVEAFGEAPDSTRERYHREFLADVRRLHRAGVRLLAGTDVPNPCIVAGASLHDELEWLVRAGLTPFEALRTATTHPALFLGMADSLGPLRPGRLADLVLLHANPLEDIRATRRIAAVVRGGRLFSPEDLAAGVDRN